MPKTINIKGVIVSDSDKWIYDLFKIEAVCANAVEKELQDANGDDVIVRINSNGGDIFAGSEIYDLLAGYAGNISIRIVGMAASAASVIAMAGAMLMIHNVQSYAEGDYRVMGRSAEALKEANRSIMSAYRNKTGKSEEELLSLMDNETYFSADKAVELGFIDKIASYDSPAGGIQLAASMTGLLPAEIIQKFRADRAKALAQLDLIKLSEVK